MISLLGHQTLIALAGSPSFGQGSRRRIAMMEYLLHVGGGYIFPIVPLVLAVFAIFVRDSDRGTNLGTKRTKF